MGCSGAPWGAAVRGERVVVGTALRLPGVVLVDARGGDDNQGFCKLRVRLRTSLVQYKVHREEMKVLLPLHE